MFPLVWCPGNRASHRERPSSPGGGGARLTRRESGGIPSVFRPIRNAERSGEQPVGQLHPPVRRKRLGTPASAGTRWARAQRNRTLPRSVTAARRLAKRPGSAGMDRRPNAARVPPPAVLAGMHRKVASGAGREPRGNPLSARDGGWRPANLHSSWLGHAARFPGRRTIMGLMKQIRAKNVNRRFRQLAGAIRRAPVFLVRSGKEVGVILSLEQFEGLRDTAWKRACRRPHLDAGAEAGRPAPG